MAITTFKRYEMKFMLNQAQFDSIIPQLLEYMEPDDHCKNGKEYSIYTIYYDTQENDLIRHSLSKPYYKEKLRLRSYRVPATLDDEVFLEIKKKIGGIVNKRRVVLPLREAYNFVDDGKCPDPERLSNKQIAKEIEHFLSFNPVYPAVYMSYKRKAFFGKDDKDFRITFDYDILTRREAVCLEKPDYGSPLLEKGQILMEVKPYSSVVVSSPQLTLGTSYTLYSGSTKIVEFELSDTMTYLSESGVTSKPQNAGPGGGGRRAGGAGNMPPGDKTL